MRREELGDLAAFLAVAQELSFTRAAAKLNTSQSALSHLVRRLEARLGVRLLVRNTRQVMPTDAGERLAKVLAPAFEDIENGIVLLSELRDKPAGIVRITTTDKAAEAILWPVLSRLLPDYPDIKVEISVSTALTDIVAERFDAGVRLSEHVDKDMIAVPIGPPLRMAVVGSSGYFDRHGTPRTPQDLARHECINLRLPTLGGLYAWEFERDGREQKVRVDGRLVFNHPPLIVAAALDGLGLACLPEDRVLDHVRKGRLIRVLEDWCPPFPGYHLYYPSRRQHSPAFAVVLQALRAAARLR
jgi:DNA-binding transcriptional LysR family regulator